MKITPTIVCDTREQDPLHFPNLPAEVATLPIADYSVKHLETLIAVERKSLPDLLACIGRERDRFVRELQRLRGWPFPAVVCECTWSDLEAGNWRSTLQPAHVCGAVTSWTAKYAPFILVGDHDGAARWVERYLFHAARAIAEQYAAARELVEAVEERGAVA